MIIIDRIEGQRAILEVGEEFIEVPITILPTGAKEGDSLALTPSPGDSSATAAQQETVELVERLRATDPGDMEIDI